MSPELLSQIATRFSAVRNFEAGFAEACAFAARLGFPYMIYAPVRNHGHAARNWSATTYPAPWQELYDTKKYLQRNPIRQHSLVALRPFSWHALEAVTPTADRELFADCRACGMADGLVVPVHGPFGSSVAVGFACEYPDAITPQVMPALQLLASYVHQSEDAPSLPGVHLTPRELTLMCYLADGLDNAQVAQRMRISDNSIEWHLKNIYRKLDARNRTDAVVKALRLRLIAL